MVSARNAHYVVPTYIAQEAPLQGSKQARALQ